MCLVDKGGCVSREVTEPRREQRQAWGVPVQGLGEGRGLGDTGKLSPGPTIPLHSPCGLCGRSDRLSRSRGPAGGMCRGLGAGKGRDPFHRRLLTPPAPCGHGGFIGASISWPHSHKLVSCVHCDAQSALEGHRGQDSALGNSDMRWGAPHLSRRERQVLFPHGGRRRPRAVADTPL